MPARYAATMSSKRGRGALLTVLAPTSGVGFACGDDDAPSLSSAPPPDAEAADAASDAGPYSTLGAVCATDQDCDVGLVCWTKGTTDTSWPALGQCSKRCITTSACAEIHPLCVCATRGGASGDGSYCTEPCTRGSTKPTSLDGGTEPAKCHGRSDFACAQHGESLVLRDYAACSSANATGADSTSRNAGGV
jgi:hypothetical protein